MPIVEFLGLNVVIVGALIVGVFLYLVFLMNKRRKEQFLHQGSGRQTTR